jgi:hypothetical protein
MIGMIHETAQRKHSQHITVLAVPNNRPPELCHSEATDSCASPEEWWRTHFTGHGLWPNNPDGVCVCVCVCVCVHAFMSLRGVYGHWRVMLVLMNPCVHACQPVLMYHRIQYPHTHTTHTHPNPAGTYPQFCGEEAFNRSVTDDVIGPTDMRTYWPNLNKDPPSSHYDDLWCVCVRVCVCVCVSALVQWTRATADGVGCGVCTRHATQVA